MTREARGFRGFSTACVNKGLTIKSGRGKQGLASCPESEEDGDMVRPLTSRSYASALRELSAADNDLGKVVAEFGPPPMWDRDTGFPTLMLLILEQQVSLASARATFARLEQAVEALTPKNFLTLDDDTLRAAGFSRQKTRYGRLLAEAVADGTLDVDSLDAQEDEAVRAELTAITGIGNWTADVYLLMSLKRPDIWPVGDLALAVAAHEVKDLPERPKADVLLELGEPWRPWRAVAARILWHYYLNTKRIKRA